MPTFDHQPPTDIGRSGYRLIRTPPAAVLTAHVISERLVGCRTHFVGNRTIPCEHPNCDPCNSGVPWRWKGYMAIIIDATQEIVIFETTARAAAPFTEYHQRYGTTRGCHFRASRLNQRPNGRILVQLKPGDLAKVNLPPAPKVEKLLCHIWNVPETQAVIAPTTQRPPNPEIKIDRSTCDVIHLDSSPSTIAAAVKLAQTRNGNNRPK